jgi:DNA mismatch repair protein MutL
MGGINVLPREITDKIAAGEVVERPASVVKELLENSLDAGAEAVRVEVKNAGRTLIRVTDDGEGMSGDDLELACRRHATSKIKSAEDLCGINTLGFRGEALSSIAAVSALTITSRNRTDESGRTIKVEGGIAGGSGKTARAGGTTVEVGNLFFNTPARLKFLKSNSTEMYHIVRTVTALALAHPSAAFELRHNGREIFNLSPHGDLRERAGLLLRPGIEEELIPVSGERALLKIGGLVARPGPAGPGRGEQFFFVNARPVSARTVAHAVAQAYRTFLPEKVFPPAVIFIETPARNVDVNVHPTKREVKFRHPGAVHEAVVETIREALTRREYLPGAAGGVSPAGTFGVREGGAELPFPKAAAGADRDIAARVIPELFPGGEGVSRLPEYSFPEGKAAAREDYFQVKNTYLVSPDEEGIVVIDQHAAHERIIFDELFFQFRKSAVEKQKLLVPLTVNLSRAEAVLMEERKNEFAGLGFDIAEFGPNTFVVNSYPAALGKVDPVNVIRSALGEIAETEIGADAEKRIVQLLAPVACHSAVRAGNRLAGEEISTLVGRLRETSAPHTCPHGRPTVIRITWKELEKRFGRK